jgi:exosome complex component RRP41
MIREKLADGECMTKRADGRKNDEMRPIKMDVGIIPRADGSAYVEWGQNKVYVGIYGPGECLPKHTSNPYRAVLKYIYRMATFSVPDRKNPRPGRREIEISKVSAEALEKAAFLERFPNTQIELGVEIIDSNAGTRVAALTAASLALADAGIPMRDLICAVGVGKANGELLVDLDKAEEDAEDAVDIPVAIMPNSGEITLLQMDGLLKKDEWEKLAKMSMDAAKKIYEMQKEALMRKYSAKEEAK